MVSMQSIILIVSFFFIKYHDDVVKWKHFPRYWSFMRGIHRSPVNSPHKGQWRGALMFSLIYAWINGWVNNREVGDLSRNRAHHDVIIMTSARKGMYRSDDQMWSAGLINFVFTEILWGFNSERVFILWCRHAWWLLHWLYIAWFQGKCTISKHIFSDCYLEHFSQNSWPWLRCPSMLDCKKTLCCHCLNDACQRYVWSAIQGPEPTSGPWWRHQMETFSALLALCAGKSLVIGEFPAQRPLTRSFDVFLDLLLNKPLSKQSWGWWFETLSRSLWCHCNAVVYFSIADNGIFWEI